MESFHWLLPTYGNQLLAIILFTQTHYQHSRRVAMIKYLS